MTPEHSRNFYDYHIHTLSNVLKPLTVNLYK